MLDTKRLSLRALLALAVACTARAALAQTRTFPERTKLGTLEIMVFPKALLDGEAIMMGPGTRILNEFNLIQIPSTVRGPRAVRYRIDMMGQVVEVWLLTPEELAKAQEQARGAGGALR